MLWPAFMLEARDFLKTRENKLFLQHGAGEVSLQSSPINQQRTHFAGERQGGWAAGVTLASLGVAPAITPHLPSSKPSLPTSFAHPQVASTVKIDPEKNRSACFSQWSRFMAKLHLFKKI